MSGEDIQGEICQDCGNTHFMCVCKRCVDCKFNFPAEDIDENGFCPFCRPSAEDLRIKRELQKGAGAMKTYPIIMKARVV